MLLVKLDGSLVELPPSTPLSSLIFASRRRPTAAKLPSVQSSRLCFFSSQLFATVANSPRHSQLARARDVPYALTQPSLIAVAISPMLVFFGAKQCLSQTKAPGSPSPWDLMLWIWAISRTRSEKEHSRAKSLSE